jgi:hypothetical protein
MKSKHEVITDDNIDDLDVINVSNIYKQSKVFRSYFSRIAADTTDFQTVVFPFLNAHWYENKESLITTISSQSSFFTPTIYRECIEAVKDCLNGRDFTAPGRFETSSYFWSGIKFVSTSQKLKDLNQELDSLKDGVVCKDDNPPNNSWSATLRWAWKQTKTAIYKLVSYTTSHPLLVSSMVLLGESVFVNATIPGLVASYPFNSNANDESGNGNNGVVYGATLTTDRFGNPNRAYNFTGIDNYIEIPSSSSLQITSPITISFWMKGEVTPGTFPIAWHRCGVVNGWFFLIADTNLVSFYYGGCPNNWLNTVTPITRNTLYHIVGTYNGDLQAIYINGTMQNSARGCGDTINPSINLSIGRGCLNGNPYPPGYYNGVIQDILIFNYPLTSDEITALHNKPNPTYPTSEPTQTPIPTSTPTPTSTSSFSSTEIVVDALGMVGGVAALCGVGFFAYRKYCNRLNLERQEAQRQREEQCEPGLPSQAPLPSAPSWSSCISSNGSECISNKFGMDKV